MDTNLNPNVALVKTKSDILINKRVFVTFYMIVALLLFSTPYSSFEWYSPFKYVNWVIYASSILYFVTKIRSFISLMSKNKLLLLFLCLVPINISIAYNTPVTLMYNFKLLGITFFSMYLCHKLSIKDWFKIQLYFFGVFGLLSLLAILFFPAIGIHSDIPHAGAWRGLGAHKNTFGTLSILAILIFVISFNSNKSHRLVKLFFISLYTLFIIMSGSRTAMVVLAILLLFLLIKGTYSWLKKESHYLALSAFVFMLLFTLIAIAAVIMNLETILNAMGRDITLTGRSDIYDFSVEMVKQKLFFGYGYGSFWNSGFKSMISDMMGFNLGSSHSGILDTLLDFGLVGLSLIILMCLRNILNITKLIRTSAEPIFIWSLVFYIFILMNNITDSRLLNTLSIFWVMFTTTSLIVVKELLNKKK